MNANRTFRRLMIVVALAATLGTGYYVGVARAADPNFNFAADSIAKAAALLNAAEVPNPKCEKARLKALRYLEKAQEQIDKAQLCIDGV